MAESEGDVEEEGDYFAVLNVRKEVHLLRYSVISYLLGKISVLVRS